MDGNKTRGQGRTALGRGLSALISTAAVPIVPTESTAHNTRLFQKGLNQVGLEGTHGISFVAIDRIVRNPSQPRQEFSEVELRDLSESIRVRGVLQPVLLRPKSGTELYEIIAGERRWRASTSVGLKQIPAIIHDINDQEALEIALIENLQREDLNPVEQATAFQRLIDEFSLSQEEVAQKVGRDRATVANYLRLLSLPLEVQQLLREKKLSMGHAKAILTIKEPSAQLSLARKAIKESLSVRALEGIVSRVVVLDVGKRGSSVPAIKSALTISPSHTAFSDVSDRLRNALGTKVVVKHHKSGRGRIEIEYFSEQELDRIIEQICR